MLVGAGGLSYEEAAKVCGCAIGTGRRAGADAARRWSACSTAAIPMPFPGATRFPRPKTSSKRHSASRRLAAATLSGKSRSRAPPVHLVDPGHPALRRTYGGAGSVASHTRLYQSASADLIDGARASTVPEANVLAAAEGVSAGPGKQSRRPRRRRGRAYVLRGALQGSPYTNVSRLNEHGVVVCSAKPVPAT